MTKNRNWCEVTLNEIVINLESGKRPKGGVGDILAGIPSLGGEHLNDEGGFRLNKIKYVPVDFAAGMSKGRIEREDILVVKDGATTGKVSFVGDSFPYHYAVINEHLFAIKISSKLNRKWIFYQLWSQSGREQILLDFRGAAQGGISSKFIELVKVVIPPIAEQHRIVSKIEELFSGLDKGIESLKTAQAQLKVYRQALLKHAFEGKLTSDSSETVWPEKPLGDLLDFLTSGSRGWAQYYATEGDLFIRAQNIKHDLLELDDIAFVLLPERTEGLRAQVRKGDLLITITGANVTKSALVERDIGIAYVSQHVALCRLTTEVIPRFLYWFIVAEAAGRKQLNDMAYGAGKPGLNLENIRSVRVSLPKLPEQQRIVELIEERLSEADQLEQTISTSLQQAEVLRQSILKRAFSGQLVSQNPNDLPAPRPGKWFVYVLECEDGSLYKGHSQDVLERWKQHASGHGAEWTSIHPPKRLVHWEEFDSQEAAVSREKDLKTGYGREWLEREIRAGRTRQADEPASVLLARIRAEKTQQASNAKRTRSRQNG